MYQLEILVQTQTVLIETSWNVKADGADGFMNIPEY